MKNGEPSKKTGAPSGSTGRATGSSSKTAASTKDRAEPKKRFGIKAKTPPPEPRRPRARPRLSVTVLGAPGAERPLFEDPLLTDLQAGFEHSSRGAAMSVLEAPIDLSWPPPPADDPAEPNTDPLNPSRPSPTPDTASHDASKATSSSPAPAPGDTAAILEAQLDLTWPSPTPSHSSEPGRARTSGQPTTAETATPVDDGATPAGPEPEVAAIPVDEAAAERDVWPDVHDLDIPPELRLAPPTQTHGSPRIETPLDLDSPTPIETTIVESSRIEIPVDLSPTPPLPDVETPQPVARRARARAAAPATTPAAPAGEAPVEPAAVAPAPTTRTTPPKSTKRASSPVAGEAPQTTPVEIATPAAAATPPRTRPARPKRAAVAPPPTPAAQVAESAPLPVGEIATEPSSPAPADRSIALPQARDVPRPAARRTRTTPAPAPLPAPKTPALVAPAPNAPAPTPPAPARRNRVGAAQKQVAPVTPPVGTSADSPPTPAVRPKRPARRAPQVTQAEPPPATPTPVALPDDGSSPIAAPGWPAFGELSSPAAARDAGSSQAESEPDPPPVEDGFRPYRAVYERDELRQDGDTARATAELEREAAWERAAEEGPPASPSAAIPSPEADVAAAGEPAHVDVPAPVGFDTHQAFDDRDRLEARLTAAERELRRIEKRTNRQNGDLRHARRREIAEAVRLVLDDGELTPHFDLLMGNGRFEFHRRGPGLSNTSGTIRRVFVPDTAATVTEPTAGPGPQIRRDRAAR